MVTHAIKQNIFLSDKNWFRTGGTSRFFTEPTNAEEFTWAIRWTYDQQLPLFVLGEGANILIGDAGFAGLVVRPALTTISHIETDQVTAGAGVRMHDLIEWCLDHHLLGLEEFSGIPGTVGGSVYINLHYFQFLLSQFLVGATVIDAQTGTRQTVDADWFDFGYNHSKLHSRKFFLVDATFQLRSVDSTAIAHARGRRAEIIRHRAARYPASHTCGSFFRNFHDHEVTGEVNGKKMNYVAYYLDKIGVKGALSVGDAIVSYQHANMIVNRGNATTADIVNLARRMQELLFAEFGIVPQPECLLVGFDDYPLHTSQLLQNANQDTLSQNQTV